MKHNTKIRIDKIKNILLVIAITIVLLSPLLGSQLSFYISVIFILISAIYVMFKKNLTLKKDRIIVLFLVSLLIAIITAFLSRHFVY